MNDSERLKETTDRLKIAMLSACENLIGTIVLKFNPENYRLAEGQGVNELLVSLSREITEALEQATPEQRIESLYKLNEVKLIRFISTGEHI